jgi:hypothetical protein
MQNVRISLVAVSMLLLGVFSAQAGYICGETRYSGYYAYSCVECDPEDPCY